MKTESPSRNASQAATAADWAILQSSQPADYDGHTGFADMTPAQRLRWLEVAIDFVDAAKSTKKVRI